MLRGLNLRGDSSMCTCKRYTDLNKRAEVHNNQSDGIVEQTIITS